MSEWRVLWTLIHTWWRLRRDAREHPHGLRVALLTTSSFYATRPWQDGFDFSVPATVLLLLPGQETWPPYHRAECAPTEPGCELPLVPLDMREP